jgi:hypothetical protein
MKWSEFFKIGWPISALEEGVMPTPYNTSRDCLTLVSSTGVVPVKEEYCFITTKKYPEGKMSLKKGKKYDGVGDSSDMKLRYDLIPPEILEELARVYTYGAKKYGENQWQWLPNAKQRYYGALIRHIQEFRKGKIVDPESELNHLSHALWNVGALLWIQAHDKKEQ